MHVVWTLVCLLLLPLLRGQQQDLAARESQFVQRTVGKLHELADTLQGQKQHARAYALRKELLLDYAEDDAKARDKCGFTKVGNQWRADASKVVLDKDLSGDKKVLKKLEPQLVELRKQQLAEHRALAAQWQAANETGKATRHWRKVLELAPGDQPASEALAMQKFFGFAGNAEELALLRRGWAIRGAAEWLHRMPVPTSKVTTKQPLLEKAGIAHLGVQSERFVVWGTLPEELLVKVAQYAERSLLLCRMLAGTHRGAMLTPYRKCDLLMVDNDAHYHQILDQCADQFDPGRLAFLKQDVDMAFVMCGEQRVRLVKTNGSEGEALDQAVRGVGQDAFGVFAEGLWEGIGHSLCGILFGRTLTFLLEQQDQKTVASFTQKLLLPDMKVWEQIAEQSAWAKSDARTSELVLISAAKFTTEQRVKAWAICDYCWHWRPELVWELDASQTKDIHTPPAVEEEFKRRTGLDLPQIDADWRAYWAKKSTLRLAMQANPLGDEKSKEREKRSQGRTVVDAVNQARAAAGTGPVGYYWAEDPATQKALAYGEQLTRREAERIKKPKEAIALPERPTEIGQQVLWARSEPVLAVSDWLRDPLLRDVLLHPGRMLFGGARDKLSVVVDCSEAVLPTKHGLPLGYPVAGQVGIPGKVWLEQLPATVVTALRAAKPDLGDAVGMPCTLHWFRRIEPADLALVDCRVLVGNRRVDGLLVVLQAAAGQGAQGCLAFVPLAPLPNAATVEVAWHLPKNLLGKGESFPALSFTVLGS